MKALIAMSGGVDSSVAAMLTQQAGYECIGCTMELLEKQSGTADAESVSHALGMPFHAFDMRNSFRENVIDDFLTSYAEGRTPNPCIVCNRTMKFGALLEKATELGCEKIVTGHYGRVNYDESSGLYQLRKAVDLSKDQSYVLYHLSQEQLSRLLLPLGELTKAEARKLAAEAGFVNANKAESQDICFVPDGRYAEKICELSGREYPPGDFVDLDGNVIGTHKGIIHYTIGQHKRLGQSFGVPRYVCRIDGENNRIFLGGPDDVYSAVARIGDCRWISGSVPDREIRCKARLRYKQQEQWATVRIVSEDMADVTFDEPQRAITPGQAAVFYDDDRVLGGGTIL